MVKELCLLFKILQLTSFVYVRMIKNFESTINATEEKKSYNLPTPCIQVITEEEQRDWVVAVKEMY